MASNELALLARARSFLETRVMPWWTRVVCALEPGVAKFATPFLLSGIFLQLQELNEALSAGAEVFRITPYPLAAGGEPLLILDTDGQGRTREVDIWVDSAVGGPVPTLRIGTGPSTSAGVRVNAGQVNPLGKVPASTRLYAASNVAITLYVIERA